ncbi:MAG: MFS transporter, partial [Bacillota bacterium]
MTGSRRFVFITMLLGVFMGALDQGIISPALTSITADLRLDPRWSVWTVTIYTLAYAMSMPLMGKLSDRYGRRAIFLVGIALFGLGSAGAALSTNLTMLLASRALQAVGGGGIFPVATAEIGRAFPRERRGAALGLLGAVFGVASVVAPNVGGFIIERASWHWIFWINVPISAVIILMALRMESHREGTSAPLDVPGTILLSGAILALMYGITTLDPAEPWLGLPQWSTGGFIALGLLLLVPFALVESRAGDPVIEPAFFRNRQLVLAYGVSFFSGILLMSVVFVPAFAELVLGLG